MIGLSYAEAAEVIGCPIRSRVARAREQLVMAVEHVDGVDDRAAIDGARDANDATGS